jgi:parvulin-like peptidyl-prolyl isomerase
LKKVTVGLILGSQLMFGQTLALINGEKISNQDLLPLIGTISQGRYGQLDPKTQQRVRDIALEQAIAQILIEKEAKRDGILKDKTFVNQLNMAIKHLKRQFIADMWLKKELDKLKISNTELVRYYNRHKNEFQQPQQVKARHILVKTENEAYEIIRKLSRYRGKNLKNLFVEYAKAKSIGPSGKNGGDLGYFAQGTMVPAFNKAVFSMKVGSITTTPVKTNFGYHIIYLEDKKVAEVKTFKEVKNMIEQKIKLDKFRSFVDKKVNALRNKASIKIFNK